MCLEEDCKHVKTGIYNITIKYPEDKVENLQLYKSLCGIRELHGVEFLISMYGQPIKCLYCEAAGHDRKNCE